jgi:hypothetical protein
MESPSTDNPSFPPSLSEAGKSLLSPSFIEFFPSWLNQSNKQEQKGLKVLLSVNKCLGEKRFKAKRYSSKNPSTLSELHSSFLKTSYEVQFCRTPINEPEIFKHKPLKSLDYQKVLHPSVVPRVDNWLKLNDDAEYKSLVLLFLRSFYSYCTVQVTQLNSTHRESFKWFDREIDGKIEKNSKKSEFKLKKRTVSLDLPQPYLPRVDKSHKQRTVQEYLGNGKIINWISGQKNQSLYQQSFIPYVHRRMLARKADFRTSIVTRLLPAD